MPQRGGSTCSRKKTHLASSLARHQRFPIATIARALGVARSNIYARLRCTTGSSEPPRDRTDVPLQTNIRSLVDRRPTYGYRRITALLRRQMGHRINHKRVYRIMKRAGLLLQRHTGRPARVHTGKVVTLHRNTRWCSDAFGIQCWNGEQL
ncbi:MAG: hypothetical protein EOO77_33920 [Oxalobacteraceae bacterium]|nr:MAG: hypothetical protein EOO77_33920 [Oxalobacteraceae bacterium]